MSPPRVPLSSSRQLAHIDLPQKPNETEAEHRHRLLIALADLKEQAETLAEEVTQKMERLGVGSEPEPYAQPKRDRRRQSRD